MKASNEDSMRHPVYFRGIRLILSFAALFFFATNSYAELTCTASKPKFSSSSIKFSSRAAIGDVVWTGTYSTTITCSDPTSTGVVKANHLSSDPSFSVRVPGYPNNAYGSYLYKSDKTPTGLAIIIDLYNGGLNVSGACKWQGEHSNASSPNGQYSRPIIYLEGKGTCTININAPVKITKKADTTIGPIWAQSPTGITGGNIGSNNWLSAPTDCVNVIAGTMDLACGGKFVAYPLSTDIAVTPTTPSCTISQAGKTLTVTLPKVSTKSLTPSGTAAGRTRFVINYTNCNALFTTTHTWQYVSPTDTQGNSVSPYIRNSDGGLTPAQNVAVRILDENFKPFSNTTDGTDKNSVSFTVTAIGQAKALTFYAEYISFGTPTGGAIQSYATYLVYYN